jgi:hypothetical protein
MAKRGQGSVKMNCEFCGNQFSVFLAHIRRGRNAKFCSRKCAGLSKSNTPSKRSIIQCKCNECKKDFQVRKGYAGKKMFCSINCMSIWRGKTMSKESHPNWKGGISDRKWSSRKAISDKIKQVGKCEECGEIENLQGHHIIEHSIAIELRDDCKNIQVLCFECHAKKHPQYSSFIRSRYYVSEKLDQISHR